MTHTGIGGTGEGERGSDQKETGENADLRSTEAEAGTWGRRKFDEALQ